MGGHRYRLPLAVAAAVVAAGAATLLLRPRGPLVEPASVSERAYFSAEQLERARDYRGPQRIIGLAGLGLSGGLLVLVAVRPPRRLRRAIEQGSRRPLVAAAAVGAGLSIAITLVELPLAAVSQERARNVGLSTQGWPDWFADVAKSAGLGALFAGGGAAIGVAIVRRFPRRWWAPGAVAAVGLSAAFVFLSPILIDPIFNKFEPLPQGKLRSEVLDTARRAGVDVGEVYRVDASRRTTGANAYVNGLGHTKRVVLYDNLIEDFPDDEVRSVVAHELGHVKHRDVLRGLAWLAIVAPFGFLLVQVLTESLLGRGRWEGEAARGPAVVPALALAIAIVSFAGGVEGNVLSRRVEARADQFALDVTKDPKAQIGLERRLVIKNVGDPNPPKWVQVLFGTHPTAMERIGMAVAWERTHR
jgi:STE24 endopeptidase